MADGFLAHYFTCIIKRKYRAKIETRNLACWPIPGSKARKYGYLASWPIPGSKAGNMDNFRGGALRFTTNFSYSSALHNS